MTDTDWLTGSLATPEEDKGVDAPFIPGKRVRIKETDPFPWDNNPRRKFCLYIDEGSPIALIWVKYPRHEILMCSEHFEDHDCECRGVVRRYMAA